MIKLIAAMDEEGCIGVDGHLPWYLPDDLKFFKKMTENQIVLMGRRTWLSLPKRPLKNRLNIIISKTLTSEHAIPNQVLIYQDFATPVKEYLKSKMEKDLFIIGGERIFTRAILFNYVSEMFITKVHMKVERGDVYFPDFLQQQWTSTVIAKAVSNGLNYTISHYIKQPNDSLI